MRLIMILALSAALGLGAAARPSAAGAATPAVIGLPPAWVIGSVTKLVVRVLEFIQWIEDDLAAQADRRGRYEPPPLRTPPLDAVTSGGSSTVAGLTSFETRRVPRGGGMIP